MRSLILSQWRDLRIGVTREDLGALTRVRARQYSTARRNTCFREDFILTRCEKIR